MLTGKIKSIERNQPSPSELTLTLEVDNNEGEVIERKLAFPIDTDEDTLRAELKRYVDTLESDLQIAAETAKQEADNSQADELKEKLEGQEVL